jgi:hypothetical protein
VTKPCGKLNGPRCSATTKAGTPCQALAGADGLCTAHSGRIDMREPGHRGGKSRRKGVAEQLPTKERESPRQHLRDKLDHATVVEAVERSLAGGNESARVAAVKFLADLELYRRDSEGCPVCAEAEAQREASSDKDRELLSKLVLDSVVEILEDSPHPRGLTVMAAARSTSASRSGSGAPRAPAR